MVSSQTYTFLAILLVCVICTSSSYTLFGLACPKHALRTCMSTVPAISSPHYCREAVAAIDCAVSMVRRCPDDEDFLREAQMYNPLGLSQQVNRICRMQGAAN